MNDRKTELKEIVGKDKRQMTSSDNLSLMNYFSISDRNLRHSAAHFWMHSKVGSEKV